MAMPEIEPDVLRHMQEVEARCMQALQEKVAALERGDTVLLLQQSLENEQRLLASLEAMTSRAAAAAAAAASAGETCAEVQAALDASMASSSMAAKQMEEDGVSRKRLESECASLHRQVEVMRRQRDAAVWELDQAKHDNGQLVLRAERDATQSRERFASQKAAIEQAHEDAQLEKEERAKTAELAATELEEEIAALRKQLAHTLEQRDVLESKLQAHEERQKAVSEDVDNREKAVRRLNELNAIERIMRKLLKETPTRAVEHIDMAAKLVAVAGSDHTELASTALTSETIGGPENLEMVAEAHSAVLITASVAALVKECAANLAKRKEIEQQLRYSLDRITERHDKGQAELKVVLSNFKQTEAELKSTQAMAAKERAALVEAALDSLQHLRLHQNNRQGMMGKARKSAAAEPPLPALLTGSWGSPISSSSHLQPAVDEDASPASMEFPSPPGPRPATTASLYSPRRRHGNSWKNSSYPWGHAAPRSLAPAADRGREQQPDWPEQAGASWPASHFPRASTAHSPGRRIPAERQRADKVITFPSTQTHGVMRVHPLSARAHAQSAHGDGAHHHSNSPSSVEKSSPVALMPSPV